MKVNFQHNHTILRSLFTLLLIVFSGFIALAQEEEEEEMTDALVTLTFNEEEEGRSITALATDREGVPIEELELYFYVQRTFSLLPFGDAFNSTDENGEVTVEFPADLPGDEEGKVTIVVKILESDQYNDLTLKTVKSWGVPGEYDHSEEQRSLWATGANAPMSLVLSTSLMILATWVIYWYIIYVLYKISRVKPAKT